MRGFRMKEIVLDLSETTKDQFKDAQEQLLDFGADSYRGQRASVV